MTIHSRRAAIPLYLVVFIDGMGLGILFPVLNTIFLNPDYHFVKHSTQAGHHNLLYALVVGCFMAAWFFGAPWLSDLSDQIGRKKTLLIALVGTCLGYVLTVLGLWMHSVTWLVLGRLLDGFTAGSQPVAQAAIVDLSPPDQKAKSIGRVLMFMSLGFVVGPMVGGVLTNSAWVSWFSLQTPVIVAACLSLINALLLWLLFQETFVVKHIHLDVWRPFKLLVEAFRMKNIVSLSVVFFLGELGWSFFYSYSGAYAVKAFSFSPTYLMMYMAVMGVGFVLGFGVLVGFFEKRLSPSQTVWLMYILSAIAMILFFMIKSPWAIWLLVIPVTATNNTAYSTLLSMYSNAVNESQQGWVMGVSMALVALGFTLSGFSGGVFLNMGSAMPLKIGLVLTLLAVIGALFYQRHIKYTSNARSSDDKSAA